MRISLRVCYFTLFFVVVFSTCIEDAYGQRRGRRNTRRNTNRQATRPPADPFGNNNQQNQNQSRDPFAAGGNAAGAAGTGRADTIPIEVIKSTASDNPLADSLAPFLRPNTAVDENSTKVRERPPLEYEHLRADDAVFSHKLWRVIDAREKINLPFSYGGNVREDNGYQLLFAILYRGVMDGKYTAFQDENFSLPITNDDFKGKISGGSDTLPVASLENPDVIVKYEVRVTEFPIDMISEYQIKEEVIFDRESSRLFTRIIGIAPMGPVLSKGKVVPGQTKTYPLFWLYYPDIRTHLSQYQAYNPKNMATRMTWEDVFENRFFSSYIVKSTFDNPRDIPLDQMSQLKDNPLFRLYEGDQIKERIFNYEQNLWSY